MPTATTARILCHRLVATLAEREQQRGGVDVEVAVARLGFAAARKQRCLSGLD